jgi:pimeloyl-ACP methyl ester carboxylesterase
MVFSAIIVLLVTKYFLENFPLPCPLSTLVHASLHLHQSRHLHIPNAGHLVIAEFPEIVNQGIAQFLNPIRQSF